MQPKSRFEKFLKPNDPLLVKKAEEISYDEINSNELKKDIEEMFLVACGEQGEKKTLVGLAAPQISISKRMIIVDVLADGKGKVGDLRLYINPEITWASETKEIWYEGCFSTGQVCGIVPRPGKIKIRALNERGEVIEEEHSGYTARILQHEIDHLDGKEFTTHIANDEDLHWVEKDQFPEYRNNEAWRNWPHKCSREKWNEMKR